MNDEVDCSQNLMARVLQEVVERRAAGFFLQSIDAAEAPIVVEDNVSFLPSMRDVESSEFIIM